MGDYYKASGVLCLSRWEAVGRLRRTSKMEPIAANQNYNEASLLSEWPP